MATAPLYNKAVTCLCDNLAEYHCNTCSDTLCSKCKAIHQKSKATSHHSVVPYGERLRTEHQSSLSCPDHKGTKCTHWCQKCEKPVCMDCVTSTHNGHMMMKLEVILKEKTTMLQSELVNLESNELKELEVLMAEAKQMTGYFLDQVNGVGKELDARAKEFHAKVDEIFNATKKQLDDMKKTSLAVLHQQEKMASDGLEKVKQEINECEEKLRNGSMESLLQYEEKQKKKVTLPKLSPVMAPTFTPSQIDSQSLVEMFGKLKDQQAQGTKARTGATTQDTPKSTYKGNAALLHSTTKQSGGSESIPEKSSSPGDQQISKEVTVPTSPQRKLIPKPSVQSSFKTGYEYCNQPIACVGSGQAWVKTGGRRLQLMDQHGAVKDTIDMEFYFQDVVLSPQGQLLLSDIDNKQITLMSTDKMVRILFRTSYTPYGLCCLHSGIVTVTFFDEGKVIIYSGSRKIVQELDKTMFKCPIRVVQNKVNNDLCICDKDKTEYTSTGKIIALSLDITSYNLRYKYTGQGNTKFCPIDLCTDNAGHVLITDFYNNRVHILDKDGRFLQYLLAREQGLEWPISIDVDSDGNTWVGEVAGGVKVVKYLK